ncbi:exopolyphosphatase [Purpureocillium lilacinum]|uniref:Exopolyphosphatase n=1 Tax=Purpureocillium lilacinum TaxID=33203 RepID=A0A179I0V8_PURLI|nr:exopolyphosphatase [Purpureocillium lilacinum]OAQ95398.1 exopolyphosphatase [Purpureocillium lilacinum]
MPPPRASLKSFLASARAAPTAPASQRTAPLTVVVGNESADLDSLCCAIVYAYIRSHSPPHSLHVPLSNLPRADLGLRTEMTAVLRRAGLAPSDLLTLSEFPLPSPGGTPSATSSGAGGGVAAPGSAGPDSGLAPEDTRWVLVDHNAITGPLKAAGYAARVVGCVDHHVEEHQVPQDAAPRVVEPCGSCMSLVVDECRAAWDELSQRDSRGDDDLVRLGLAAILLDTVNLTAEAKVKDKDVRAVKYLESKAQDESFSRDKYFEDISAVKEDISGLSFRDIFRKDYKEWEDGGLTLGVSCVVQDFSYLLDRADGSADTLLEHLSSWAKERNLDVAAVMTTSHPDGEFQRHLLVWGVNPRGSAAASRFADIAGDKLGLNQWQGGELDAAVVDAAADGAAGEASAGGRGQNTRFAWRQHDLAASRKQVAPLLREAMRMG